MLSRLRPLVPFLVAAALPSVPASAQTSAPSITVQVDQPRHAIPPRFYGLMTEEINYSYDGGLYAEMVRNRTFTDHGWDGIANWYLDTQGSARATMHIDTAEGPSAALPYSLQLNITSADPANAAAVRNEGYWGMLVKPDTVYKGSLYAKAGTDGFGPLTVSLVSDLTGKVVATATTQPVTGAWGQYQYTLTTGKLAASSQYHLLVAATHPGKLWLSLVSLFPPTYDNRANGNRIDLMEMMAAMHPGFLRMPGGNYLEGDQIDERFDWKTTLGPLVDRPTHRSPWGYQSSDGMGLLEFLQWTEELHIEPLLAVYAGYSLKGDHIQPGPALTPFVQDALEEIEFVTGDTSTHWGAMRAKLGHPAPFPLHYVEIGNEDEFDRSGSYEGRYAQFAAAIKAKYPNLQLIATTPVKRSKPDVVDDHYYKRADEFFAMQNHYDSVDRATSPKIFVGEWATREGSPTTNLGAALGDAAWMTGMERNSDLIVMASYAPLFVNVNPGGMQWASDLIGYDEAHSYGSPGYYAQALFAEFLGTEVSTSQATGLGDRLFYSATADPAKGEVYLKLVNGSSLPQTVALNLDTAKHLAGSAEMYTLSGTNPAETNSIDDPKRIVPVRTTIKVSPKLQHTIPPYSIEVLVMKAR